MVAMCASAVISMMGGCIMDSRCPLDDDDLIFQERASKKIKQDERVEQTEGVAKEEGLYFY